MKLVTVEQMRALEERSAAAGVPPPELMENAGLAVAQEVWMALGVVAERPVVVLVGPGNNGGDGLVAARHLHEFGAAVACYLLRPRDDDDPNYRQVVERGIRVVSAEQDPGFAALSELLESADAIVDALLGTGRARGIQGDLAGILRALRERQSAPHAPRVYAVDLPTGVDADTGQADDLAVRADMTIALGFPKVGLHALPGAGFAGRVTTVDIGIPAAAAGDLPYELLEARPVRELLPARPAGGHKGTFGRLLIAAGSRNYLGAPRLAAWGALRVGAGLTTIACPQSVQAAIAAGISEGTWLPLPDEGGYLAPGAAADLLAALPQAQALVIGPGLSREGAAPAFVRETLAALPAEVPAVVDADALNALAASGRWWTGVRGRLVLTPHPGEFSRLTGLAVPEVQADRLGLAVRYAGEWGHAVVLKGAYVVVAAPDGRACVSPYANPLLGTGGTGDVLSGAIGGLLAQGLAPFEAACIAAYVGGMAAEAMRDELGDSGLLAGELPLALARAVRTLKFGAPPQRGPAGGGLLERLGL